MSEQGEPNGHWLTRMRVTPLDGACCNALLLAHWSLSKTNLCQLDSVQLHCSLRALRLSQQMPQITCLILWLHSFSQLSKNVSRHVKQVLQESVKDVTKMTRY